jgi:hypothetical protein
VAIPASTVPHPSALRRTPLTPISDSSLAPASDPAPLHQPAIPSLHQPQASLAPVPKPPCTSTKPPSHQPAQAVLAPAQSHPRTSQRSRPCTSTEPPSHQPAKPSLHQHKATVAPASEAVLAPAKPPLQFRGPPSDPTIFASRNPSTQVAGANARRHHRHREPGAVAACAASSAGGWRIRATPRTSCRTSSPPWSRRTGS